MSYISEIIVNRNDDAIPKGKLLEGTMIGEGLTKEDALLQFDKEKLYDEAEVLFCRNCRFSISLL